MMRKIYSMSRSKSDIGDTIEQGTRELILHLIKLWMYPDSYNKPKWRKEVAAKLNQVDSFKGSHRYPSAKFILDNSWKVHQKHLAYYIDIIEDDYGDTTRDDESFLDLKDRIDEYFEWVAEELSIHGQVSYKMIYTELEILGF